MENNIRPVPIGIDNFKKIIEDGYCYVEINGIIYLPYGRKRLNLKHIIYRK